MRQVLLDLIDTVEVHANYTLNPKAPAVNPKFLMRHLLWNLINVVEVC